MFRMSKAVVAIIERKTGRKVEELANLSLEEETELVEGKTGRKLKWPKFFRKRQVKTIEEVNKRLDKITKN